MERAVRRTAPQVGARKFHSRRVGPLNSLAQPIFPAVIPPMDTPPSENTPPAPITLWQRFKAKEISYLTIPLLIAATIVEFVILSIGYNYQKDVCVPPGMGVTFFGIGPIGAVMLAVELLKLPLAIWTASRRGWLKAFMVCVGLPLICVLTFQLVKDMAVYEMGVAMNPAYKELELATVQETKIARLNAELENQTKDDSTVKTFVAAKKAERDRKLAELAAKLEKSKAEIDESLKRNDAVRNDAITLTDYERKELSEVESRQAKLIAQFNADTEQLTKAIAELRTRREFELSRATAWNAEEARIENAYKARLNYYTNLKNAYDKAKAEYDAANYLKRQVMQEPVNPGVPPEREVNKLLKPTLVAELEAQIKTKEAELVEVSNRRRESVAQVEADARRLREGFDRRSTGKREETDRKREELLAAMATLVKESTAEAKAIDAEFNAAVAKEQAVLSGRRPLETVRNELAEARKIAEAHYETRETAIRKTQVHRIATTVEIVRGLLFGERPMSVNATAKERGDILTGQIDMVRIWVYPVLAFIVAFLPTLMVEIGFTTLFKEGKTKPSPRLGLFARNLHRLYIRAGRHKILRAERLAAEAAAELAERTRLLERTKTETQAALTAKDAELRAAKESLAGADMRHAEEIRQKDAAHRNELQRKEEAWNSRLTAMSDSLNQAILEKDELRDLQKAELERQIRIRQDAWLERVSQLRRELDEQREAFEAERAKLTREHHEKLLALTEESKAQLLQVRRQAADAELAAVEKSAKLAHELKEAGHARQAAEANLKNQTQAFEARLAQANEEAARNLEIATREGAHRVEHLQLDFANTLRQREEDFEHRLRQHEQELTLAFDARLIEERNKVEQEARRREAELERRFESRAREVDARWNQQVRQLEETADARLKQREQQLQAQTALLLGEKQTQAELEAGRREAEFNRRLEARSREAEAHLREQLQQQEMALIAKMKQQEQDLLARVEAREAESQVRRAAEAKSREEEYERQAESRVRAIEARLNHEAQQKDEALNQKLRLREQQLQAQADARVTELQGRHAAELRTREEEMERRTDSRVKAIEARLNEEAARKEEAFTRKLRQREQQLQSQLEERQAEAQAQAEQEAQRHEQSALRAKQREAELIAQLGAQAEAHKEAERKWEAELQAARANAEAQLARVEKERAEADRVAAESVRQVRSLEEKLKEVSSIFTNWKGGPGK